MYPGCRTVAYDNERGKGDRRHRNDLAVVCALASRDRLLADREQD
jgi:hypothetical protein